MELTIRNNNPGFNYFHNEIVLISHDKTAHIQKFIDLTKC